VSIVVRDHPKTKDKWKTKPENKKKGNPLFSTSTLKSEKALAKEADKVEKLLKKTAKQRKRLLSVARSSGYSDKQSAKLLSSMRSMTINMLPRAEETYQRFGNERAAYAYNSLVSQIREIENDMRLVADLGHQAEKVVDIFSENFRNVARNMVQRAVYVKRNLVNIAGKKASKAKDLIDEMIKDHAQFMETTLQKVRDDIFALMTEPKPKQMRKKRR